MTLVFTFQLDVAELQGCAVASPEFQPLADQDEDLPDDENEMKAIANKIAKELSLDEEDPPENGSGKEGCGELENGNGGAAEIST